MGRAESLPSPWKRSSRTKYSLSIQQTEYYVPLKPQGEYGQADCNYLAWHRLRTPPLAPFQNQLLTKVMQKHGHKSGS